MPWSISLNLHDNIDYGHSAPPDCTAWGVIFGRPMSYTVEDKKQLSDAVAQTVIRESGRADILIVLGFDVGYTDPQLVVPLGVPVMIDSDNERVLLTESPFKEA